MKQEERDDIRRRALARAEAATHDRLLAMRSELDVLARGIDRLVLPHQPRLHAGMSSGLLPGGVADLLAFRKGRKR